MPNSFTGVLNNAIRDRHFGGTAQSIVADPYISGYHYIKWVTIPKLVAQYTG